MALRNRSVQKCKGKKKEHSPQDAAMTIQRSFRDYMSRHSRAVHCLRDLAVTKSKLKQIRILFSRFSYRHRLAKDAEERQRFSEKIIILLLRVDSIEFHRFCHHSAKQLIIPPLLLQSLQPRQTEPSSAHFFSLQALDYLARSAKRSMTHELEAVLEAVDPKLMRHRKFDLLSGFSSTAIASSVADIVGMLNQEDANDSDILPVF